jgi:carboxypeptidase Q
MGCCAAVIATVVVPAYSADKKAAAAEAPSYYGPQPATENIDLTMYARIRDEGFHHSHVMEFGGALSDGIGPRLTGSPNMARPISGRAIR